jgi:hypothetical protein
MANSNKSNGSKQEGITTQPMPASQKIYVHGHHRPEIGVPMRAISVGDSHAGNGNAPILVYDTSGPYTDPTVETDIRKGLQALRLDWIKARGDRGGAPVPLRSMATAERLAERFPHREISDASRRPVCAPSRGAMFLKCTMRRKT